MDTDPGQSFHEIGVARKLILAPGKPEVVTPYVKKYTKTPVRICATAKAKLSRTSTSENSDPENLENMGNSRRNRHQLPEDAPIRGNFIPLSSTLKGRSPSPHREQGSHGVYLQLSLTDSQMDRLTAVLSPEDGHEPLPRGRPRHADQDAVNMDKNLKENTAPSMRSKSPAKPHPSTTTPSRARSRSPVKFHLTKTPESQRTIQGVHGHTRSVSPCKTDGTRPEQTPTAHKTPTRTSGRHGTREPPTPINTDIARAHARLAALQVGKHAVIVHNPPERESSPARQPSQYAVVDDSSSYYSQDSEGQRYPSCISPLRIHKESEPKHLSILKEYTEKKNSVRGSDKESEQFEHHGFADEESSAAELAYTPLAPFLPHGVPTVRKASKTLIGEGGWLENTSKPEPNTSPTRGGGFLGNLVKKAKEIIETNYDNRAQRKSRDSDKSRPTSRQLAISLSPREQSLLYCELEFALTTALNDYITAQFAAGRLSADKLRRVADEWQRKGRPRVVGFRYDLETQLDLVRLHAGGGDFKFYSRAAASATAVLGVLDTARASARALRVRTFCQPDTVVAKQLLDAQGLFNVLGCPEEQQIKLAEVVAFFKAAVERRRVQVLMEEQQQQQQHQQQQQRQQHQHQEHGTSTSPVRNSRSPAREGGGWWGTAPAVGGQIRGSGNSGPAGKMMDPAGYESQDE
ncbi:hypothetical protein NEMBOFW57_004458 [Staphylotrichum longicolle]|uniref:Uncharacterized protein n=1 Tax=Staphylotrichum longicolle TaxID=669026 RepID=A0AAD4F774_9PEZI|nr:hypothetical protein NEMBOFW57_004458 [Staphylotrichum longicolle]